jgi:hypothetical protein
MTTILNSACQNPSLCLPRDTYAELVVDLFSYHLGDKKVDIGPLFRVSPPGTLVVRR